MAQSTVREQTIVRLDKKAVQQWVSDQNRITIN